MSLPLPAVESTHETLVRVPDGLPANDVGLVGHAPTLGYVSLAEDLPAKNPRSRWRVGRGAPVGRRFGAWIVLGDGVPRKGPKRWLCRCDCGGEGEVLAFTLRGGKSLRCRGCVWRASRVDPDHANSGNSPEYRTWTGMRRRCNNPCSTKYRDYGGRGITVCERWNGRDGYTNFLADVGRKPSPKHSLDRIDVNGNYEPSNCRWATQLEQLRNRRNTVFITWRGRTQSINAWAEETGIRDRVIRGRLGSGWDVERLLSEPARVCRGAHLRWRITAHTPYARALRAAVDADNAWSCPTIVALLRQLDGGELLQDVAPTNLGAELDR
jgi:hypothetical protein